MAGAATWFIATSLILLLGYGASVLARRGRFPDLFVLIALGALLGPINSTWLHLDGIAQGLASIKLGWGIPGDRPVDFLLRFQDFIPLY